jgi:alkylation response protein AidB-like acyl-CoA dehydrogenase
VRAFADQVLAPTAAARSEAATFDAGLVPALAELGLFGLMVPEEHGGSASDLTMLCLALEGLARHDSSVAATVHTQAVCLALLDHLGTYEQKHELLRSGVEGRAFVCFGLTEPTGGSDAGNIATKAERIGDGWVINGAKQFITNSGTPNTSHVILFAATGSGRPRRPEVSAFLVPIDAPGVTVAPAYSKLGWKASDTHPIYFSDVAIRADAMLGAQGRGYPEAVAFTEWTRFAIAAMAVGVAQGCLDETLRWVKSREAFGKKLSQHQSIAFKVAEMAAAVSAARAVTYDGCYKFDNGHPFGQEAAIAKLVASETANRVAYCATQLQGGYGFMEESAVTRHYRDARILTIGEGTSEVQKLLIARSLGLEP